MTALMVKAADLPSELPDIKGGSVTAPQGAGLDPRAAART